jgi:hypothetical protein
MIKRRKRSIRKKRKIMGQKTRGEEQKEGRV